MRRLETTLAIIITPLFIGMFLLTAMSSNASAAPVVGFDAGRIIDDIVFTNNQSMNVDQIQTFLNGKVPICDNWGTNGSTSTSRRDFFVSKGWPLPLKCLKEYTEGDKSSAQIIYDAAQEFRINPQVLIVLLQKEQGLVTDTWPDPVQYRSATGYGCPDTAACDSQYYGLTNQIRWSARMFRAILNDSTTWYTPYELGNNYIPYNPNALCGGSTVSIQNRSTAALYNYTPYQPNNASLAAGYGSGDACSSYGSRNFYQYFKDWFGSTYGVLSELQERYDEISGHIGDVSRIGICDTDHAICWQEFENGFIIYTPQTKAWESKGSIRAHWASIGYQNGAAGLPIGPEVYDAANNSWSQRYQSGTIMGSDGAGFWLVINNIDKRWQELKTVLNEVGLPKSNATSVDGVTWQEFKNGFLIGNTSFGFWESKGAIRAHWASIGYQNGAAGLPIGPEVYDPATKLWSQKYQNGTINYSDAQGSWFAKN